MWDVFILGAIMNNVTNISALPGCETSVQGPWELRKLVTPLLLLSQQAWWILSPQWILSPLGGSTRHWALPAWGRAWGRQHEAVSLLVRAFRSGPQCSEVSWTSSKALPDLLLSVGSCLIVDLCWRVETGVTYVANLVTFLLEFHRVLITQELCNKFWNWEVWSL